MAHEVPTIEVPHPDPRWEDPIFSGYMVKRGNRIKSWSRRWFILTRAGQLWYFGNENAAQPRRNQPVLVNEMKFWRDDTWRNCIRIERYPSAFFFRARDANERLEWIKYLSLAGGIHVESVSDVSADYLERRPEIATRDLATWNRAHVAEWLGYQSFTKDQSFSQYSRELSDLSGSDLETLTEPQLMQRGILNLPHRKRLMRAVQEIRTHRVFNYAQHVVRGKIGEMTRSFGKMKNANWRFLSRSLSDPECMKETYLNPSILQDSLSRFIGETSAAEEEADSDDEDDLLGDGADIMEETCRLRDQKRENFRLPVKLVVTEMVRSEGYKNARRFLSPFLAKLPNLQKEFGVFHTAIIVGPWYLEWTDSSLCIPRKLYSSMALVSADIDTTTLLRNTTIEEVSMKLARVICRWNTEMVYCNLNMTNDTSRGNCQEFIEDLMAVLEISLRRDGAFGNFLSKMRLTGQCDMVFSPSPEFRETFLLQAEEFQFDTHAELDEFVRSCGRISEIALTLDFKEENKLLKSFDRAFWLRHFKKPDVDQFRPGAGGCPFDDPRRTRSYMTYS